MAIMFGSVDSNGDVVINNKSEIVKTVPKAQVKKITYSVSNSTAEIEIRGTKVTLSGVKLYDEKGASVNVSQEESSQEAYAYLTGTINGENISEIVISAETFPGNYYCTGDTYARSEASGEDEFFQLVIPKAKVTSENTLTMEAEGDPSTFSMNLKVLRPADGKMMKLIKYSLPANV